MQPVLIKQGKETTARRPGQGGQREQLERESETGEWQGRAHGGKFALRVQGTTEGKRAGRAGAGYLVGLVVVGRDGLWIVVDHDRLVSVGADGADGAHGAPVELNRAIGRIMHSGHQYLDHERCVADSLPRLRVPRSRTCAPNAPADAVHARAEHHDAVVLKGDVVLDAVVGHVQVVGVRRELGSD